MEKNVKKIPTTVGIIMDGNRRWAKANNLPKLEGHRLGYKKIKELMRWAKDANIQNIIVYAFSTENWNRTKDEVSYLMDLFRFIFKNEIRYLKQEGIRVRYMGTKHRFSPDIRKMMEEVEEKTKTETKFTLGVALSYG